MFCERYSRLHCDGVKDVSMNSEKLGGGESC